ncbi:response regulator [Cohnella sp. REN36]|uniref:response regulator n=1 Tax=Cohnella sp. REN36 TaxID=2887347 RepID=UPI001D133C84|nr:response regulator [Cohnella sp. REN36]MCC3377272.1 response regulator [Cohnella sp. REN36]
MHVLIVDDEIYAVMGMKDAIDWGGLGVTAVYEAYNMREAVKIYERHQIDVMICDIEMPKGTGIELLEWVNAHSPYTETIFLTAHGDFRFMQRAIQLRSFDYIMKPVEFDAMTETLGRAIRAVEDKRSERVRAERYEPYYELWTKKKTLLGERFWYDVLAERIVVREKEAESLPAEYGIVLQSEDRVLPVLISVENWKRELSTRDEEVMEYAVRQTASELVVAGSRGEVVHTKHGVEIALLYVSPAEADALRDGIGDRCGRFIDACARYLNCSVSCYIGEPVTLPALTAMYKSLLSMEYNNLSESNQLSWLRDETGDPVPDHRLPDFAAWALLLEHGKEEELIRQLRSRLRELATDRRFGASVLDAFYLGFLQMIHYLLQKKGLSAHRLLHDADVKQAEAPPRTVEQLEERGVKLIAAVHRCLDQDESVIRRVRAYIADHLGENITREMLAEFAYLNPAYLSRLFKKEVGMSITDYLLNERMRIAKELIAHSSIPISEIARSLGYSNFSYFSKMFRKVHQANPQQLRKLSGISGG